MSLNQINQLTEGQMDKQTDIWLALYAFISCTSCKECIQTVSAPRSAKCQVRDEAPNLGPRYNNVVLDQVYFTPRWVVVHISGMMIIRGNQRTQKKLAPVPLHPP
jgi:hypothetical protein